MIFDEGHAKGSIFGRREMERTIRKFIRWTLSFWILVAAMGYAKKGGAWMGGPMAEGDSSERDRFLLASGGQALAIGGSFYFLEEAWYSQHPRTRFHFFDDSRSWLQMDKAGHFWSGHQLGAWSSSIWSWSGMERDRADIWGTLTGLTFLSGIETMDGFSKGWGFSLSDAGSNLLGAGSFWLQKRFWGEAYILPVFSYKTSPYAKHRPGLLGENFGERLLKDYNGQTYWLDLHPHLFAGDSEWPDWLALSVGYGASGMLGGTENPSFGPSGDPLPSFQRHRRYFLSVDLLMEELPVEGKGWRTLFKILDAFKFPLPALEYNERSGLQGHWLGP
jgi:hypothetical protein